MPLCVPRENGTSGDKKRNPIEWTRAADRNRNRYACIMEHTDPDTIMSITHIHNITL